MIINRDVAIPNLPRVSGVFFVGTSTDLYLFKTYRPSPQLCLYSSFTPDMQLIQISKYDHVCVLAGSLLASIAVLQTATYAASGAGLNELYALTVNKWRGLTFFVIGCITFLSALIMM